MLRLLATLSFVCFAGARIPQTQTTALLELYDVTGGPFWWSSVQQPWIVYEDACEALWFGVQCSSDNTTVM